MTYADYILATGGAIANLEEAVGRYTYRTYFRGLAPILDIGPGRCWFTRQDAQNITALDNQPALVDYYGERGLTTKLGSVYDIPFRDETFAGVFCRFLFEHLHEPDRAIQEIARVLQPGGYLYLGVPSPRTLRTTFYDDFTHVRPYTKTSLLELAREGGFSRSDVEFLYWTRGTGKVAKRVGPGATYRLYRLFDNVGRRLALVNRNVLVLHAWK